MAAKKKVIELDGFCLGSCHSIKKRSDFYKTNNRHTRSGLSRYCKDCSLAIFKDNLKTYKSLESATYYTCAEIGVPFIKRAFDVMEEKIKGIKEPNYVSQYMSSLTMIKKNSDIFDGFDKTDTALGDITSIRDHERSIEEQAKDLKLIWGDYAVEDLQFLEYMYTTYTGGMAELSVAQESLYRDLCKTELKIRKADESNSDADKLIKSKMELMKRLKIDNFTIEEGKEDIELFLEGRIAIVEREKPCFHYENKYKNIDFSGYEDYMEAHIKRPFRNLLKGSKEYHIDDNVDPSAWLAGDKKC